VSGFVLRCSGRADVIVLTPREWKELQRLAEREQPAGHPVLHARERQPNEPDFRPFPEGAP
jgi:hypothetical protein